MNKAELFKELFNKATKAVINRNWWTKLKAKIDGTAAGQRMVNEAFDWYTMLTKKEIEEELKDFEKDPHAYIGEIKESE